MLEPFQDREQAGRLLAQRLVAYQGRPDVPVLGLARGGVAVAYEIAEVLRAPLDVFVVRKLGVPGFEELAMGAISGGGVRIIESDVVAQLQVSAAEIDHVVGHETEELNRRERIYRAGKPALRVRNRVVVVVDDGIATGSTMRVAIKALRGLNPARIIVAAGVAPLSSYLSLRAEADEIICLAIPREFFAVGEFYAHFPQLTDEDVCGLLEAAPCRP
jgi:putative phosphoribosyl transferase